MPRRLPARERDRLRAAGVPALRRRHVHRLVQRPCLLVPAVPGQLSMPRRRAACRGRRRHRAAPAPAPRRRGQRPVRNRPPVAGQAVGDGRDWCRRSRGRRAGVRRWECVRAARGGQRVHGLAAAVLERVAVGGAAQHGRDRRLPARVRGGDGRARAERPGQPLAHRGRRQRGARGHLRAPGWKPGAGGVPGKLSARQLVVGPAAVPALQRDDVQLRLPRWV
mmetsp:Transcript_16525/g.39528  ORF Transcript_16525/g.39528 Transcript_16525/m.39528 type:complete len:222 (+) Transcript_16525:1051-1716(+)